MSTCCWLWLWSYMYLSSIRTLSPNLRGFQLTSLVISVSMNSVVIHMVKAVNVSKFEMVVHIFDLDHRIPFRQTELSASRSDQVCSCERKTERGNFIQKISHILCS
uniref:Secreted protein n=1 Tax=Ascaris lumbricoides TaxID=6252 RepID=A0A0M3I2Q1_ASCLU